MQKSRMGTIIHALCYIFLVEPLLSSGFTVASTNSITEPDNLHMRLVGGWNRCSGRVEIYYQDVWGTVCDDIWDIDNAAVVCRQLNCGYASAAHGSAYFGEGSGHIVLDDVRCTGSEQYLWQCPHAGWGYHNCGPHEDASVICSGSHEGTTDIYPVSQTYFSVPSYTGCGGLLMQHSGDITSPFFPSSYPSNARCIWEIRTSPGYIVQLTFQHFNLENSGNNNYCPYDWVAIYDGIPEHSPLLGLICGSGNYTFYSSSNIIGVEFISDNSVEMNGFQAQFTSIYGNSSANYPIRLVGGVDNCSGRVEIYYQNEWGTVCDDGWHIRNAEVVCRQLDCGSPVSALSNAYFGQGFGSIIMDDVNCNGNEQFLSQCPHRGWLSHNCVHSEDAGVICSASIGATSTVRPATPSVQPNITTVPSNTSCGGLLIQHSGVITSPLYPNNYPPNARCTWDIRTNPGYIVKLAFQTFNLESGGSNSYCPYDWVAIYDGIPEYSSLLGKFCGSGNYTFYSSSNIMGVAFRSDSSVQLSGFQAVFTSITSNSSGNYPLRLVGGMDQCAGRVEIYYQNAWGTVCDDGWNIRNADIVCRQLKCGSAVSALSNAYFGPGSGRILLDDVICNGTEQYLWECPHRGWGNHDCSASEDAGVICSASSQSPSWNHTVYTTTTPVYTTTTPVYTTTTPVPSNTSCGGLLIQQSGVITSPSYPNNYPPYARCTWDIRTNPGYIVKLAFQTFNLESGGSNSYCPYDWVAIYDGIPEYSSLLGKFCGSGNYTFYSSSNIMGIEFRSDSSIQLSGFQAVFTSITSNSSGNYPMRLAGGMDQCAGRVEIYYQNAWGTVCDDGWNIRNADIVCRQLKCGSAVSALSNAYFGPGSGRILLDDVICNGTEQYLWECPHRGWGSHDCSASEDAGVICSASSQSPSWNHTVYTTTTPVTFNTTWHQWSTTAPNYTCGGILTNPTGLLSSPLYPGYYPNNAYCVWEIRVTPGHQLELTFLQMDLEYANNCVYDSVTIYDGLPLSSPQLDKICISANHTYISNSNIMGIVFRSDSSVQGNGFQAVYTSLQRNNSTPVNCGGILTNPWGIIESPSYPYSHNPAECTWHIQAGSNQVIQISFDDFALENSYSCANAYVAVYDGSPLGSALLGKFCGSYRRNFTSSSNSLSVVYFSRGSNDNFVRGFHSSYVFVTQNNQNVTLTCTTNYMEARISVWYLQSLGFSSSDIFLNDPQCRPQTYGSWLTFYIYYNQCGTLRQGERDTISYSNTINGYNANEIIERSKKLSLNLQCQMYQNSMVEIMYHANDVIQQNLTRYGLYNAGLAFYYNPSFTSPVYQYPYYVQLDQNLYLQATLHSSDPDLILFVDTCVASPSSSDFVTRTYDIIRNGCVRDSTYSTYSSPYPYQARFGFRAFGFLQNYSSVYLQCKLTVCQRYNYNSRCYQGCLARRKRAAEQIHDQITVSLGPFERKN
ncbi:deleted in malignant brain tumors 1 [Pelobates cultripes]|uniref:Scavenger receptor cysteine-rich domain-containing protein DMBT1 n=1 Tax=Pelobates cultripes TaxID=61616 RepID=A0AAD1REE7_PELCU|nr:deleted in malignant brain tumors 1 [Pelobates cultripes]